MKYIILIILAVLLFAGCKNQGTEFPNKDEKLTDAQIQNLKEQILGHCEKAEMDTVFEILKMYDKSGPEYTADKTTDELATIKEEYEIFFKNLNELKDFPSIMSYAAFNGNAALINFLLEKGIDPLKRDKESLHSLEYAIMGKHEDIINKFITPYPPRTEYEKDFRIAVVRVAAIEGNLKIIKHYIRKKNDIPYNYRRDKTLLMFASEYGKTEIVKYLLSIGSDAAAVDGFGNTAESLALDNGFTETAVLLGAK